MLSRIKILSIMPSFLKIVLKGNLESCPFAPRKKPLGPLGAAAIAGGASLIGNLLGFSSSNKANETNMEIARMNADLQRETNKQNYQIFKEQNAFNLDMWNKQNQYNNPSAQVARLQAAGINPMAVFGNGSVSEAGSLQSAPSPNMVAPQFGNTWQSFTPDFSGVGDAVSQAIAMRNQSRLTESQANFNDAKAEYEWLSMGSRLLEDYNRAEQGSFAKEQAKRNLDFFNETFNARKQSTENAALMSDKDLQRVDLEIAAKKIENQILSSDLKWRDKMNAASYQQLLVGIKQVYSSIRVNDAQAAKLAADEAVERARKAGLDIDNDNAKKMSDAIIDAAYLANEESALRIGNERKRYYGGRVGYEAPHSGFMNNDAYNSNIRKPIIHNNRTR